MYDLPLFGSRVRGERRGDSDFDLPGDVKEGRTMIDYVALKQDVDELLGCHRCRPCNR